MAEPVRGLATSEDGSGFYGRLEPMEPRKDGSNETLTFKVKMCRLKRSSKVRQKGGFLLTPTG